MWQRAKKGLTVLTLLSMLGGLLAGCGADATATTAPAPATNTTAPAAAATNTTAPAAAATDTTAPAAAATNTSSTGGAATATTGTAMTGTTGSAITALPTSCSNVQISYWNQFTGPDGPFMQKLADDFSAGSSGVKVNMVIQADLATQLQTAAAADTLPDLVIVNEDAVATQAFRNIIRPMDDVVAMAGIDASDYPAIAWQAGQVAGKLDAVPLSFVAMTMYWNMDILTAAGITKPPTTGAEFAAAADAITKSGTKGFDITSGFPNQQIFQMLLHQYGGSEYSPDGMTATWNSDAGVKALQWMKDAQSKWSEPTMEVDADLNAFKAGSVGMIWNGIWQVPNVTGTAVSFKSGFGPPPQIGDKPAIWGGGPLFAMAQHKSGADQCKDAGAALFIKYVEDNAVEWAKAGNIPASNKARASAAFKALPQASFADAMINVVFPPPVPGIGDAFAPLGNAIGQVLSGKATDVKQALDDAATASNKILEQNRQNYGSAPGEKPYVPPSPTK
jgi:multiple sugar transport system substrate-binding protein